MGTDLVQAKPSLEEPSDVNVYQYFRPSSDVIRRVGEVDVRTTGAVESVSEDGVYVFGLYSVDEGREVLGVADWYPHLRYPDVDAVSVGSSYPVVVVGVHHALFVEGRKHQVVQHSLCQTEVT